MMGHASLSLTAILRAAGIVVLALLLPGLHGCVVVSSVSGGVGSDDGGFTTLSTVELNRPLAFDTKGTGVWRPGGLGWVCEELVLDFGDGTSSTGSQIFLGKMQNGADATWRVPHTYAGWPGKKLALVKSTGRACYGEASVQIDVQENGADFRMLAVANHFLTEQQPACGMFSGQPSIRRGSGVRLELDLVGSLSYCALGGCVHPPSGEAGSTAPASFPFPGLPKFAVVYRVGRQVIVSNDVKTVFVATDSGRLEVCFNDDMRTDNDGGFLLKTTINEISAK